jgi:hypothetical protein
MRIESHLVSYVVFICGSTPRVILDLDYRTSAIEYTAINLLQRLYRVDPGALMYYNGRTGEMEAYARPVRKETTALLVFATNEHLA